MADRLTLRQRLKRQGGDRPDQIPFLVWLLENPDSCFALPGCIDLHGHDCLHVLLQRGFSPYDEAFVLGFAMGNDVRTRGIHVLLLKMVSQLLYPAKYRFVPDHLISFDLGYRYGKAVAIRDLNKLDYRSFYELPVGRLQQRLGIDPMALSLLKWVERLG
jgi:hypothetical protein